MNDVMQKSSKKPKFLGEGIDRISNLPDHILHNILSSFYTLDLVELGNLSNRWNSIWKKMPCLNFDIQHFRYGWISRPRNSVKTDEFKDFVNWVLINHCADSLIRFRLDCGDIFDRKAIFRLIRFVTTRNVQQLVLSFDPVEPFELPYCVATCEFLHVLKLNLEGAMLKLPNHFGFYQLKFLHLLEVELSNETSCLLSTCPVLEKLILGNCSFGAMIVFDIASTSLVYVSLQYNIDDSGACYEDCDIKISCPNLKVLKYNAPKPKDIILENLLSIEVVHICFYGLSDATEEIGMIVYNMIKNVDSTSALKICIHSVMSIWNMPREVRNFPVMFYKLKSLKLAVRGNEDCIQIMMLLLKNSPNLEVLDLLSADNYDMVYDWDENWKFHDPNETIMCLESHLKLLKLTDFRHKVNEMELLRFFLKNALVLEKMIIVWHFCAVISDEVAEMVLKYPRTSSHAVVTFLESKSKSRPHYRFDMI